MAIPRVVACGASIVVAMVGLVSACSSETTIGGAKCGAGTTLNSNGECVPVGGNGGSGGAEEDSSLGGASGGGGQVESGVGGSAGGAGTAGAAGDPSGKCPKGLPGPKLIEVPRPGGGSYCIDATEVTRRQYEEFVAAKILPNGQGFDMTGQPPDCLSNDQYSVPSKSSTTTSTCPPRGTVYQEWPMDEPIHCVDWCDAYMYCGWAGKRLCGRVGGGEFTEEDAADPAKSEWLNACSNGGTTAYPYGDEFDPAACSTAEFAPVGSSQGCRGKAAPYDSLYDMSGNAAEWMAAVIWDPVDKPVYYPAMGGNVSAKAAKPASLLCVAREGHIVDQILEAGIRCCADVSDK